jgi:hypothetical protein
VCFIKETVGPQLFNHFNIDNVCWESDYPHSDGTWPNAPEELLKTLEGFDDATINKVSYENAMKHYNFDPFKHIPKDQATAGALRALSPDVDVVTRTGRLADERDLAQWNSIISGAAAAAKS